MKKPHFYLRLWIFIWDYVFFRYQGEVILTAFHPLPSTSVYKQEQIGLFGVIGVGDHVSINYESYSLIGLMTAPEEMINHFNPLNRAITMLRAKYKYTFNIMENVKILLFESPSKLSTYN